MKTFRELISWELEQEKRHPRLLPAPVRDAADKLRACALGKWRYLRHEAYGPARTATPSPKTVG